MEWDLNSEVFTPDFSIKSKIHLATVLEDTELNGFLVAMRKRCDFLRAAVFSIYNFMAETTHSFLLSG